MDQHFCDFVPHSNGWAVLLDGSWVASYPSLHLAVDAVKTGSEKRISDQKGLVMRRLDVDGHLRNLAVRHAAAIKANNTLARLKR